MAGRLITRGECQIRLFCAPGDRVHAQAVAIAPHHYRVVRLHRGIICGALLGHGHLVIQRTRYFDFSQQPAWQGMRKLG